MAITEKVLDGGIHRQRGRDIAIVLALIVVIIGLNQLYYPLNEGPERFVLKTPLDEQIPLIKPFVVPYVSALALGPVSLVILLAADARLARSALIAAILTLIIAYLFYYFGQTYVARPDVPGDDVFSRMLRTVYGNDNPYNCFPSLHNAFAVITAVYWVRFSSRYGKYVAAWCGLIMLSTLFVHQHYVADMAGGAAVAALSCWVAYRLDRK